MRKFLLLALFFIPLTGCLGRVVSYEPGFSQRKDRVEIVSLNKTYTGFILKQNPKLDRDLAGKISGYIDKYCKEYEIDIRLVLALIAKESSFRANVVSTSGAIGLGQLKKATAKDMGVDNPFEPEENVKATTKLLSKLFKKWEGNIARTLASYKMGSGTVINLVKSNKDFPDATKKYISDIISLKNNI